MKNFGIKYYLDLPWTYRVEQEETKGKRYFIVYVNELPGVCTDNEDLNDAFKDIKVCIQLAVENYLKGGEEVPIPISRDKFKGKIAYRTNSERHYKIARAANIHHLSISKVIDIALDQYLSA